MVTLDGAPWFVARDVMEVLGFSGVTDMLRPLAKSERGNTPHPVRGVDGKNRYHTTISESGLYKLVMRSDKPQAKDFQNWVTQTVLPSIRKDGGYVLGEEKVVSGELSEDEFIFKAMSMLQAKAVRLTEERDEAQLREQQALKAQAVAEKQRDNNRAAADVLKKGRYLETSKSVTRHPGAPAPALRQNITNNLTEQSLVDLTLGEEAAKNAAFPF